MKKGSNTHTHTLMKVASVDKSFMAFGHSAGMVFLRSVGAALGRKGLEARIH